jgi:carboxylesterase type B
MCPQSESEDCLTLNIWTPIRESSSPRSVMFFMPGGRFEQVRCVSRRLLSGTRVALLARSLTTPMA